MSAVAQHIAEPVQKAITSFADFCVYDAWKSGDEKKDKSFVGIRLENSQPKIYFPMGYRPAKPFEDICKQDFYRLVAVLNDKSLQKYFSEDDLKKSQLDFPFYSFLAVLQYYLDFGYFVESETIYKKGFSGKISWPRTIKRIKPQVIKDEFGRHQVVYLNLITRKASYREDNLITLVHKYCVKESARLIGPLYGVSENEVEDSELLFDYELFAEVIQDKIAATFNDKHLELFHAMLKVVRYLGNKENRGENGEEPETLFGVNTFAPIWEGMVDRIFGNLPQGLSKSVFNPHLKWNGTNLDVESEEEKVLNDPKRSTLRPDTIMVIGQEIASDAAHPRNDEKEVAGVYILDSKYYKFGITHNKAHLPGAESVCKQMAYAEYVEQKVLKKEIPAFAGKTSSNIYNAFVMPYCADGDPSPHSGIMPTKATSCQVVKETPPDGSAQDDTGAAPFGMKFEGYIYGDWKTVPDANRPYYKIACVLLDVKSVMQNYANSTNAQKELAKLMLR